ncbi:hypothetical protein GCM10023213_26830 [Prosthecobacter algae]|uniref:Uncharacterized protein n=1 Tax=Prosthecobacter algae TaxID=1144682 RepID=A0ABP9P7M3_9BACT
MMTRVSKTVTAGDAALAVQGAAASAAPAWRDWERKERRLVVGDEDIRWKG